MRRLAPLFDFRREAAARIQVHIRRQARATRDDVFADFRLDGRQAVRTSVAGAGTTLPSCCLGNLLAAAPTPSASASAGGSSFAAVGIAGGGAAGGFAGGDPAVLWGRVRSILESE